MRAFRRGGRVVEGAPLLRAYRRNPIEGSNPSLSAINKPGNAGFFMARKDGREPEWFKAASAAQTARFTARPRRGEEFSYAKFRIKTASAAQTARFTARPRRGEEFSYAKFRIKTASQSGRITNSRTTPPPPDKTHQSPPHQTPIPPTPP